MSASHEVNIHRNFKLSNGNTIIFVDFFEINKRTQCFIRIRPMGASICAASVQNGR